MLNNLTGGRMPRLLDMLLPNQKPEKTAEEAEREIMAEFERLGGGAE